MIPIVMALWENVLMILWMKGGMKKEMVKKNMNEVIVKIEEGTYIMLKGRCVWWGVECEFVDDVRLFIANGHVIIFDPNEAIIDNKLGEDHVNMSILYSPNNILVVITIWKWRLAQTIVDRYFLRHLFISYNECNIPIVDEEGQIVIRKKQCTFQKKMQSVGHFDRLLLKINKVLSHESIQNVNSTLCCT